MIFHKHLVWRNNIAIPVTQLQVGDKIAVIDHELNVTTALVKSILPVFVNCSTFELSNQHSITLAHNSCILTDSGMIFPSRGDLLVCGSHKHSIQRTTESLTKKRFYDIMIDKDLPVIIQDGYCVKVKHRSSG